MVVSMEAVPELYLVVSPSVNQPSFTIRLALEVITEEVCLVWPENGKVRRTKVFALYEPVFDRLADALSCLFFIPIVASTVKKTIASFDGIINCLEWASGTVPAHQIDLKDTPLRKKIWRPGLKS